ncbi:hypothetical protein AB6O49_30285 [Streptomyces sp. SBR177]
MSWFKADPPDRIHETLERRLGGWHTMMITAVDGEVTYSLDGKALFTSSGRYVPREPMDIHFSNWFVDLPFTGGPRTWDMKVDWVYYKADEAVSRRTSRRPWTSSTARAPPTSTRSRRPEDGRAGS